MADDLKDYVLAQEPPIEFKVRPHYSKAGDFVSFCWVPDEPFFTRRVDEYLTCYYSMRTQAVVGCKLKGIRFLLGQLRQFVGGVTTDQSKIRITIKAISIVGRGLSSEPAKRADYEPVWENGRDVEIDDPELQPA